MTDSEGQGELDTDIVREARTAIQRGEEGERPCQTGTCQSEGDSDGGIVRYAERTLRLEASQGRNETDRNPVYLLRRPHGERGAVGEKDRATGSDGSCLGKEYTSEIVFSRDCYILTYENRRKIRPKCP